MAKLKTGKELENSLSSSEADLESSFIARMRFCADKVGSVSALAKKADISQSGIRRYFDGGEPTRPHLIALAAAAGVRVGWLATGEGPDDDLYHGPDVYLFGPGADEKPGEGEELTEEGIRKLAEQGGKVGERSLAQRYAQEVSKQLPRSGAPGAEPPPPELYAALVGPLSKLTSNPDERKWVMMAAVEMVSKLTDGNREAMAELNESDLAHAVQLAVRVRKIWLKREAEEEGRLLDKVDDELSQEDGEPNDWF